MSKGWHNESQRHSLAARGIRTTARGGRTPVTNLTKARKIGMEFAHRFSSMDSLQQYGIDKAYNRLRDLAKWETEDYYILLEEFYIGFGSADVPPLPKTKSGIKKAILNIIDRGDNDIRDIDAALYEVDFRDEIDELVKGGVVREVEHECTTEYYRV